MFKEKKQREEIISSSFSRIFFPKDKHQIIADNQWRRYKSKKEKRQIFHIHKYFKQFEIFFLPFFSSPRQQNKNNRQIINFSCAKNYQTFGLKDKQEDKKKQKKTNKSAALFFLDIRKRKRQRNKWMNNRTFV